MKLHDITLLEAIDDPALFGSWFKKRVSWENWFTFLKVLFALGGLTPEQLELFQQCTGRTTLPSKPFHEVWLCCGRRAGKSFVLALIAVYLACFREYRSYLQPGERATIVIVSADRKQSRTILNYIRGMLTHVPMLKRMIERETAEGFDLNNSVTIEIHSASWRSTRGYTIAAILADEIAYWRFEDTSANPDREILNALRPAMATIPHAMLLCASSPYAMDGEMWRAYRRHYRKDDAPVMFWKAPTRVMNPGVPQRLLDEAYENDPDAAAAEYGADFRAGMSNFIARNIVDACVVEGRHELPYRPERPYLAFLDPNSGGADSMTLSICHAEGDRFIEDVTRERKSPFNTDEVCKEFADLIKAYGLAQAFADNHALAWVRDRFAVNTVDVTFFPLPKSKIYLTLLPMMNSRRVELLDEATKIKQLCNLQRKTAHGGHDTVDHPPGQHDDVINAVAGALVALSQRAAQQISFAPPISFYWDGTSSIDHVLARAAAKPPPAPGDSNLEERHTDLTTRRNTIQHELTRIVDDALVNPAAASRRDQLNAELDEVNTAMRETRNAMAAPAADQSSTASFISWSGSRRRLALSDWSAGPDWPRLR